MECAKRDIEFAWEGIDPLLVELYPLLQVLALVHVATAHHEHVSVTIDKCGRWFGFHEVGLSLISDTHHAALEALLLGYRLRPILLPGQREAMLHGEIITTGHPDLFILDDLAD